MDSYHSRPECNIIKKRATTTPPQMTLEDILSYFDDGILVAEVQRRIVYEYIPQNQEEPMSLSDDGVVPFVPSGKMLEEEEEIAKSLSKQVALLVALAKCKPLCFPAFPALKSHLKRHIRQLTSREEKSRMRSALVLLVASHRVARIGPVLLHCGLGKTLRKLTVTARNSSLGLLSLLADKVYSHAVTIKWFETPLQLRERFSIHVLSAEFLTLLVKSASIEKSNAMLDTIWSFFGAPAASSRDSSCPFFLQRLLSYRSYLKSDHVVKSNLLHMIVEQLNHQNPSIVKEALLCVASIATGGSCQMQRLVEIEAADDLNMCLDIQDDSIQTQTACILLFFLAQNANAYRYFCRSRRDEIFVLVYNALRSPYYSIQNCAARVLSCAARGDAADAIESILKCVNYGAVAGREIDLSADHGHARLWILHFFMKMAEEKRLLSSVRQNFPKDVKEELIRLLDNAKQCALCDTSKKSLDILRQVCSLLTWGCIIADFSCVF